MQIKKNIYFKKIIKFTRLTINPLHLKNDLISINNGTITKRLKRSVFENTNPCVQS